MGHAIHFDSPVSFTPCLIQGSERKERTLSPQVQFHHIVLLLLFSRFKSERDYERVKQHFNLFKLRVKKDYVKTLCHHP